MTAALTRKHPEYELLPSPTGAKMLALLDLMAAHPAGLSSAEAARHSGITVNLVFRLLLLLARRLDKMEALGLPNAICRQVDVLERDAAPGGLVLGGGGTGVVSELAG